MAGLSPAEIAQPIRSIVHRQANVTVLMALVTGIDLDRRSVAMADGSSIAWDFLVIACGADTSYFGHEEWAKVAPGLKSIEDAIDIRQRVLLAFELAEREKDPKRREELLSFVVIGGGPTGVELAGALAELSKFVLARDFRTIDPRSAKVRLFEAGPRILAAFPPSSPSSRRRGAERARRRGADRRACLVARPRPRHAGRGEPPLLRGHLGRWSAREPAHARAWRAARSIGSRAGPARPHDPRSSPRVRDRRRRIRHGQGRKASPGRQPRGHAGGARGRPLDPERRRGGRAGRLRVSRQGLDGDDRAEPRGRRDRAASSVRPDRVACGFSSTSSTSLASATASSCSSRGRGLTSRTGAARASSRGTPRPTRSRRCASRESSLRPRLPREGGPPWRSHGRLDAIRTRRVRRSTPSRPGPHASARPRSRRSGSARDSASLPGDHPAPGEGMRTALDLGMAHGLASKLDRTRRAP